MNNLGNNFIGGLKDAVRDRLMFQVFTWLYACVYESACVCGGGVGYILVTMYVDEPHFKGQDHWK